MGYYLGGYWKGGCFHRRATIQNLDALCMLSGCTILAVMGSCTIEAAIHGGGITVTSGLATLGCGVGLFSVGCYLDGVWHTPHDFQGLIKQFLVSVLMIGGGIMAAIGAFSAILALVGMAELLPMMPPSAQPLPQQSAPSPPQPTQHSLIPTKLTFEELQHEARLHLMKHCTTESAITGCDHWL